MSLAECPTSLAWRKPELVTIIRMSNQAEGIAAEFGHAMGSPSEWPGRLYDAVSTIKNQDRIADKARLDADK